MTLVLADLGLRVNPKPFAAAGCWRRTGLDPRDTKAVMCCWSDALQYSTATLCVPVQRVERHIWSAVGQASFRLQKMTRGGSHFKLSGLFGAPPPRCAAHRRLPWRTGCGSARSCRRRLARRRQPQHPSSACRAAVRVPSPVQRDLCSPQMCILSILSTSVAQRRWA